MFSLRLLSSHKCTLIILSNYRVTTFYDVHREFYNPLSGDDKPMRSDNAVSSLSSSPKSPKSENLSYDDRKKSKMSYLLKKFLPISLNSTSAKSNDLGSDTEKKMKIANSHNTFKPKKLSNLVDSQSIDIPISASNKDLDSELQRKRLTNAEFLFFSEKYNISLLDFIGAATQVYYSLGKAFCLLLESIIESNDNHTISKIFQSVPDLSSESKEVAEENTRLPVSKLIYSQIKAQLPERTPEILNLLKAAADNDYIVDGNIFFFSNLPVRTAKMDSSSVFSINSASSAKEYSYHINKPSSLLTEHNDENLLEKSDSHKLSQDQQDLWTIRINDHVSLSADPFSTSVSSMIPLLGSYPILAPQNAKAIMGIEFLVAMPPQRLFRAYPIFYKYFNREENYFARIYLAIFNSRNWQVFRPFHNLFSALFMRKSRQFSKNNSMKVFSEDYDDKMTPVPIVRKYLWMYFSHDEKWIVSHLSACPYWEPILITDFRKKSEKS